MPIALRGALDHIVLAQTKEPGNAYGHCVLQELSFPQPTPFHVL